MRPPPAPPPALAPGPAPAPAQSDGLPRTPLASVPSMAAPHTYYPYYHYIPVSTEHFALPVPQPVQSNVPLLPPGLGPPMPYLYPYQHPGQRSSSTGSKRRRTESVASSNSGSPERGQRSNFTGSTKSAILKAANWTCLHCGAGSESRIECAHLIAACASRTFTQLRRFHLLRLESLKSPDNGIALCPNCHTAFDGVDGYPGLLIVPSQLDFFFDAERNWQADPVGDRSPTSHSYLEHCRVQHEGCLSYTAHMDRDFFPAGLAPRLSHFDWSGDPMAVLRRSFVAAAQIVHPELLDPALCARLLALQELYRKGNSIMMHREAGNGLPNAATPVPPPSGGAQQSTHAEPSALYHQPSAYSGPSSSAPTGQFAYPPHQPHNHVASGLPTPISSPTAGENRKRKRSCTSDEVQVEPNPKRFCDNKLTEALMSGLPVTEDFALRVFLECLSPDGMATEPQQSQVEPAPAPCSAHSGGHDDGGGLDDDLDTISSRCFSEELPSLPRRFSQHGGLSGTANRSIKIHRDRFYSHQTFEGKMEDWMMQGAEVFIAGMEPDWNTTDVEVKVDRDLVKSS